MSKRIITKKQSEHVANYVCGHYDRIQVNFPKGYRDKLKAAAEEERLTMSRFLVVAACEKAGIPVPDYSPTYDRYEKDRS